MTKLPSESFWPSRPDGEVRFPFPKLTSESSSSLISPLTLPRGVSGYFDHVASKSSAPTQLLPASAMGLALTGLSPVANESIPPISFASAGYPRSSSADAVSAPSQAQLVQRLVQQNARMREAWEAERKYLEANRERAEEVYKEERALMEEERIGWDAEKAALLQEIARLQQALGWGGGTPLAMNGTLPHAKTPFSNLDLRGGTQAVSRISPESSLSSQGRPRIRDLASPRSPNGPSAPTTDFLKPSEGSEAGADPVPIVDVKEIHPELEGIPIKATSVKKATFTDTGSQNGSTVSSPSGSPPANSDQAKSPQGKKEQTLQVLAAREADRLTMHAGHTPNHSLSSLATVASSGTASASSNGGDSTPTMPHGGVASSQGTTTAEEGGSAEPVHTADPFSGVTDRHGELLTEHPEPIFEPRDDRELKGPLMLRNMPAHDEIFFQKLSDKLQEVSKDDKAALPAVLKDSAAAKKSVAPADQLKSQAESTSDSQQRETGSDGSGSESDKSSGKSNDEEDHDVPLKFKKRMNFGAPFGEFR
ncbi:hypothetical protein NEMBOFW57_001556 [Staphylotrichum longicolle]|uniref:Uncharacterized protein n=1 Tax=Staphylotrichum longicolle TaxID=669026 RepID=A0AAD4F1P7_9PEZI|nr:hypothetical protein NEMBOFW57_001556 [Staphylotrichum longicolle]